MVLGLWAKICSMLAMLLLVIHSCLIKSLENLISPTINSDNSPSGDRLPNPEYFLINGVKP